MQASLDAVDTAMSTWDDASELSRFNAHRGSEPFSISADTLGVVALAQRGRTLQSMLVPLLERWVDKGCPDVARDGEV